MVSITTYKDHLALEVRRHCNLSFSFSFTLLSLFSATQHHTPVFTNRMASFFLSVFYSLYMWEELGNEKSSVPMATFSFPNDKRGVSFLLVIEVEVFSW